MSVLVSCEQCIEYEKHRKTVDVFGCALNKYIYSIMDTPPKSHHTIIYLIDTLLNSIRCRYNDTKAPVDSCNCTYCHTFRTYRRILDNDTKRAKLIRGIYNGKYYSFLKYAICECNLQPCYMHLLNGWYPCSCDTCRCFNLLYQFLFITPDIREEAHKDTEDDKLQCNIYSASCACRNCIVEFKRDSNNYANRKCVFCDQGVPMWHSDIFAWHNIFDIMCKLHDERAIERYLRRKTGYDQAVAKLPDPLNVMIGAIIKAVEHTV